MAYLLRENLGFFPCHLIARSYGQRHNHVKPLAAGCLAKASQAQRREPLAHLFGGINNFFEAELRRGIEIEYQPPGDFRCVRRTIPRMQFKPTDLRDSGKSLDAVDLQIGFAITGHGHKFEQVRSARHCMALEKRLSIDTIRRAHH